EVGPALIVKQLARWLANRASGYGYPRYRLSELLGAALLWKAECRTRARASYAGGIGEREVGHKGFDFREIRKLLRTEFRLIDQRFSPFPALGAIGNSTVFFLA